MGDSRLTGRLDFEALRRAIERGAPDSMLELEGVAIVEFRPALKADEFFESFFGLARDGKVSPKTGLPNLLWMALILRHYRDFVHLARPPLFVQRAVFTPLVAVARLLGYGMPFPYPYSRSRAAFARFARGHAGLLGSSDTPASLGPGSLPEAARNAGGPNRRREEQSGRGRTERKRRWGLPRPFPGRGTGKQKASNG